MTADCTINWKLAAYCQIKGAPECIATKIPTETDAAVIPTNGNIQCDGTLIVNSLIANIHPSSANPIDNVIYQMTYPLSEAEYYFLFDIPGIGPNSIYNGPHCGGSSSSSGYNGGSSSSSGYNGPEACYL